jgi:hypothetical protein
MLVLPIGMACAGEPDYEAVGNRLIEAVEAEELSPEEAAAMMGELARARFIKRLQASRALRDEREREHEHEENIEEHLRRLGLDGEAYDRVIEFLEQNEFSERQVEHALRGMLRIVYVMREEGEDIELDRELLHYFREEIELTDEQIELVKRLAQRISSSLRGREGRLNDERFAEYRAIETRIRRAVETGRLKPEEAEQKLMEIRTRMFERKEEREEQTGIEDWMLGVGKKLKEAVEAGDLDEDEAWAKWQEIKETGFAPRLKAAVERGQMSEEEAKAVWHRIEIAEIGAKLRSAVKKGEMTEEEANAKMQAIKKKMYGRKEQEEHREEHNEEHDKADEHQ